MYNIVAANIELLGILNLLIYNLISLGALTFAMCEKYLIYEDPQPPTKVYLCD